MHVAAVEKIPASYEHIPPERVGNRRHIVVSELSGRGNVRMRANELGIDVQGAEKALLERIKELESQGYQFEAAEGSFELLGRRSHPDYKPPFEVLDVVVISERRRGNSMFAEATVKLKIEDEIVHTVAEGTGPVHALDGAFHKALNPHFARSVTSGWSTTRSASSTLRPPQAPRRGCSSRRPEARSAGAQSASRRTSSRRARPRSQTPWSCRSRAPRPQDGRAPKRSNPTSTSTKEPMGPGTARQASGPSTCRARTTPSPRYTQQNELWCSVRSPLREPYG